MDRSNHFRRCDRTTVEAEQYELQLSRSLSLVKVKDFSLTQNVWILHSGHIEQFTNSILQLSDTFASCIELILQGLPGPSGTKRD